MITASPGEIFGAHLHSVHSAPRLLGFLHSFYIEPAIAADSPNLQKGTSFEFDHDKEWQEFDMGGFYLGNRIRPGNVQKMS